MMFERDCEAVKKQVLRNVLFLCLVCMCVCVREDFWHNDPRALNAKKTHVSITTLHSKPIWVHGAPVG